MCQSEVDENVVEELHEGQYQLIFFNPESLLTVEVSRICFKLKLKEKKMCFFLLQPNTRKSARVSRPSSLQVGGAGC